LWLRPQFLAAYRARTHIDVAGAGEARRAPTPQCGAASSSSSSFAAEQRGLTVGADAGAGGVPPAAPRPSPPPPAAAARRAPSVSSVVRWAPPFARCGERRLHFRVVTTLDPDTPHHHLDQVRWAPLFACCGDAPSPPLPPLSLKAPAW